MGNLWKVLMFIWSNKDMLWSVLQEIIELFNSNEGEAVKSKACRACSDPRGSALAELGQQANIRNRSSRR